MSERETPFEPKASLRDLLSEEEFREILAPLPGDGEDSGGEDSDQVVLLLSEFPEDAEELSAFLLSVGCRVHPVVDRYLALDAMRTYQFTCFVMSVSNVGSDLSGYLERVRDVGSVRRLGFIADRGALVPSWLEEEGVLIRRPLESADLERIYSRLVDERDSTPPSLTGPLSSQSEFPPPSWDSAEDRSVDPDEEETPSPVDLTEGRRFGRSPRKMGRRKGEPNWLAAVRALLEAQRSGESLILALRRWAESDPACFGWGEVRDDGGELFVRAGGSQRAELVAALAVEVTQQTDAPTHPETRGEFSCLPSLESWTAFWWRDPDLGRRGWEQMGSILSLIEDLRRDPPGVEPISGASRDRLLRLIDGRMHACRRHGGKLIGDRAPLC